MPHGEWATSEGGVDEVNCGHGDLCKFPIVPLHIKFKGKMHTVKAADNSRLSHPLFLGTICQGCNTNGYPVDGLLWVLPPGMLICFRSSPESGSPKITD